MGKTRRASKSRWEDGSNKSKTRKPKRKDDVKIARKRKHQQYEDKQE